ncbi:MAG: hypothetical protein WD187_00955 [Candidatus Woykebacteria bacterium]
MNAPAVSLYLAKLPIEFLRWWFLEAPITLIKILRWVFAAFVHLFSFKELFTTFFRPWKNEYREGLVRTAIFIGAFFKSIIILFDIVILGLILIIETGIFIIWMVLPLLAIFSIYGAIFA